MRVALFGTGKMGTPIARRLAAAGHDLVLWNRTPERARAVGVGEVAASPADAARGAALLLSILTDAAAVRSAYAGIEPQPDQVVVEMSTAGPEVLGELAERFPRLLAAPILGSVPAIESATAVILVGGERADFEAVREVLGAFGEPRHAGTRWQAIALKLLNNSFFGACSALAAELQAGAVAAGLDPEQAFAILERTMPYLAARKRGYVDGVHEPPTFFLRDMLKDLDLALQLYHGGGAATPMLAVAREMYAGVAPAHGQRELTAVIERYRGS